MGVPHSRPHTWWVVHNHTTATCFAQYQWQFADNTGVFRDIKTSGRRDVLEEKPLGQGFRYSACDMITSCASHCLCLLQSYVILAMTCSENAQPHMDMYCRGICRRVVEVEQVGESKVLMFHTSFTTEVRVTEDDSDPQHLTTEFELIRSVSGILLTGASLQ